MKACCASIDVIYWSCVMGVERWIRTRTAIVGLVMLSVPPSCWPCTLGRSPSFGPCQSPAKHAISKRIVVSFGRVAGGSRRRSRAGGSKCRCRFSSCLSFAPRSARAAIFPSSASHRRFGRVVTREERSMGRSARGWSCDARRGAWGVRAARLSASPSPRSALVMRKASPARGGARELCA